MAARNPGTELELGWISKVYVNQPAVVRHAEQIQKWRTVKGNWQAAWLLKAVTCIDLTTLSGDDTPSNVHRMCFKAKHPIREDLLKAMDMHDKGITVAAVCVYPARVTDAVNSLKAAGCNIPVASVAAGFPSGQTPLETKLAEIKLAVQYGAREIDIVISRSLVLSGQWESLYEEIRQCREACGEAHMKTILATGELGSLANVYKASMIAMMAARRKQRHYKLETGETQHFVFFTQIQREDIGPKMLLGSSFDTGNLPGAEKALQKPPPVLAASLYVGDSMDEQLMLAVCPLHDK
ncbi:deoxyribose-phosphate aldolase isoform X2 [Cygnus olor]|uniref:deoxyribose-phosphate aldolase isoform X2 n=1 Tax=Cygnus olor TaxID=8869 RepID=UPI001ADE1AE2|nr:deoxyribose-phosphate aldolase isoform X2 [Cygnus olor]